MLRKVRWQSTDTISVTLPWMNCVMNSALCRRRCAVFRYDCKQSPLWQRRCNRWRNPWSGWNCPGIGFYWRKSAKYDSPIAQGGSNVSGGQKQRLSIARAIAKNPKVFIFDDSFSALDLKTDAALRKALSEKVSDSTVIIVAQRISTVLHAEQILVMDEGRIVGRGTHEELLANCEVYRQIAKSQMSEKELGLAGDTERRNSNLWKIKM